MSFYLFNVTVHVLAAVFWLGGLLFLAAVGAPVLRRVEPAELRAQLFRRLGERFRWIGWVTLGVLVVTGVLNLWFRGLLRAEVLGSSQFWSTPYGRVLAAKLVGVTLMLAVQSVHDFAIGPRASRLLAGTTEAARSRRTAAILGRMSALIGLLVLFAAVRLARGG
jgi:putative copper export protein